MTLHCHCTAVLLRVTRGAVGRPMCVYACAAARCRWFVECSRDDAEALLLSHRRDGNVLMRPSSDHQYALTVRTATSSGASVCRSRTHARLHGSRASQAPPPAATPCTSPYSAPPLSVTRRNQYDVTQTLACARRLNDVTRDMHPYS